MSASLRLIPSFLVALAIVLPTLYAFGIDIPKWWTGVPAWLAGLMLWRTASQRARTQSGVLALVGVAGLVFGYSQGADLRWDLVIASNALIIAMLASVSFMKLVVNPDSGTRPGGGSAMARTALGVHLFGSVINMSILYIVAQRLTRGRPLDDRQAMLLTRSFGAAAFWSPFFAAMGVALTYSPGSNLHTLMITGAPLALVAILVTVWHAIRHTDEPFEGCPLNLAGLMLPALLAVLVLIINAGKPDIPVIAIICLIVPPISLAGAMIRGKAGRQESHDHLIKELPNMPNELALFLAAGVMAAGTASVFASLGGWMPFDSLGAIEAGGLLGLMLVLAVIGVHPVISIAVAGTLLAPLNPPPDLLASIFLCAWAIGVAVSPLSGMNLALQGRFGLRAVQVLRVNWGYGVIMYIAAVTVLYLAVD